MSWIDFNYIREVLHPEKRPDAPLEYLIGITHGMSREWGYLTVLNKGLHRYPIIPRMAY